MSEQKFTSAGEPYVSVSREDYVPKPHVERPAASDWATVKMSIPVWRFTPLPPRHEYWLARSGPLSPFAPIPVGRNAFPKRRLPVPLSVARVRIFTVKKKSDILSKNCTGRRRRRSVPVQ